VSDLVNAIRAWDNGADYRVLTSTQGLFSLVTGPSSGITDPLGWPEQPERVSTGLLEDSIIYYTAVRMMQQAGLDPETLEIVPTLQIPVRVELLLSGDLEAAVLPEPVTRLATAGGARVVLDSSSLSWTPGVVIATGLALRQKPRELEAFLRAYDRGVAAVNQDPDRYRGEVVEKAALPPATMETMVLPTYLPAAVPRTEQVADVAEWMLSESLIEGLPRHQDIVAESPF
jgi:NitT/TauT family transport system substrate-binding protein